MALRVVEAIRGSRYALRDALLPSQRRLISTPPAPGRRVKGGETSRRGDAQYSPTNWNVFHGRTFAGYERPFIGLTTIVFGSAMTWFFYSKYNYACWDDFIGPAMEEEEKIVHRNAIRDSDWKPRAHSNAPRDGFEFDAWAANSRHKRPIDPLQHFFPPSEKPSHKYPTGSRWTEKPMFTKRPESAVMDFVVPAGIDLRPLNLDFNNFMDKEKETKLFAELEDYQAKFASGAYTTMDPEEYEERMERRKKFLNQRRRHVFIPYTITFTSGGRPIVFTGTKEELEKDPGYSGKTPQIGLAATPEEEPELRKKHLQYLKKKAQQEAGGEATGETSTDGKTPAAMA